MTEITEVAKLAKILAVRVFVIFFACNAFALMGDQTQVDRPSNTDEANAIAFADSVLECGVYYQYSASGMKKNPHIPSATVRSVAQNAASLLETADLIYTSAGISTKVKHDALMQRARTTMQQRQNSGLSLSNMIYEYGEKCRQLLVIYPSKLRDIAQSRDIY